MPSWIRALFVQMSLQWNGYYTYPNLQKMMKTNSQCTQPMLYMRGGVGEIHPELVSYQLNEAFNHEICSPFNLSVVIKLFNSLIQVRVQYLNL